MTQKTYRTAQGKIVDLGALQLKNENVRAVGNMNVNAKGDLIDGSNRPISSRNDQVGRQYKKQVTNVSDDAVVSSKKSVRENTVAQDYTTAPLESVDRLDKIDGLDKVEDTEAAVGLAAAIARARQIKQEPLKTPRQVAQEQAGVKKI
jgi:hypothetical protein